MIKALRYIVLYGLEAFLLFSENFGSLDKLGILEYSKPRFVII